MSPSWRERLLVSLEPGAVHAARLAGGMRARVTERRSAPADESHGAEPWEGALEALRAVLGGWEGLAGDASVVLCNCLVRYAVVPQAVAAGDAEEQVALARHHFARVHGERARDWNVRVGDWGLASAVDQPLIEALKAAFAGRPGLRLRSIQPYLMAAYNAARSRLPREGAWLVLPDSDRTCVALLAGRQWAGVSVSRGRARGDGEAAALVARERWRFPAERVSRPAVFLDALAAPAEERYAMALSAR